MDELPRMSWRVVLLAEDVDRNVYLHVHISCVHLSSSSRRTWIEMIALYIRLAVFLVVLLAEDVDRNICWGMG